MLRVRRVIRLFDAARMILVYFSLLDDGDEREAHLLTLTAAAAATHRYGLYLRA